jgi:hypothetical protein
MRTITQAAIVAGFLCSIALLGGTVPVMAQGYYYGGQPPWVGPPPRYDQPYGYYRPARPYGYGYYLPPCAHYGTCCPRGFTVQDGVCKPYRGY